MATTPDSLHVDTVDTLTHWTAPDPDQDLLRRGYLDFLSAYADATRRSNRIGHITGSTLVVSPQREQVLLTLHPLVGRWLQLGGHLEDDDARLVAAARREAVEEGGIVDIDIDPMPLRLDRHRVRCRDGTGGHDMVDHLDVQYLAIAPLDTRERISDESWDLQWWSWDALPDGTDDSVRALVREARVRLGA